MEDQPQFDFLDKQRKTRREFIEIVGLQRYKLAKALVPVKLIKMTQVLFFFLYKSGITFGTYLEVIMGFGYTLLYDLIVAYKISSWYDLLKIQSLIRKSINEFIMQKDSHCPFFRMDMFVPLFREMKARKMTPEEQIQFIRFMLDSVRTTQNYIIMPEELMTAMWRVWDGQKEKVSVV